MQYHASGLPAYNTSQFMYSKDNHAYIAEDSDFGSHGFATGCVYDDSANEGFSLTSERTGRTERFALDRVNKSDEHEILSWEFVPCNETLRPLRVIIYND